MCRCRDRNKINELGFSLMELIIVIAVIGIISSIAAINYNQWMVKSAVEAQVKQMVSDIGELRIRALTTKQRHNITINADSYVFKSYTTENQPKFSGNLIPGGTHNVTYGLKKASGSAYGGEVYVINERGMLEDVGNTIFLDYNGSAATDCLTIHTVRVNPGKKNATGDVCNDK